jgi:hypothetical protein
VLSLKTREKLKKKNLIIWINCCLEIKRDASREMMAENFVKEQWLGKEPDGNDQGENECSRMEGAWRDWGEK